MKKAFFVLLILVDLGIIGASAFLIYLRATHQNLPGIRGPLGTAAQSLASLPRTSAGIANQTASTMTIVATSTGGVVEPAASDANVSHKLFSYRNPKAQQVFIRGDFTGWRAEPMRKDEKGTWIYEKALTPGEYGYCFSVNDKIFPDPNNKHKKLVGKTPVSSVVVLPRTKP